jgi:hypothetical protein
MMLPTKSKVAFLFSAERLFEEFPVVTFWTFTVPDVIGYREFMGRWHRLLKLLKKHRIGHPGLRVVERHPGGHGFHIHALIGGRMPIRKVLKLGNTTGFGRLGVEIADQGSGKYLAKYLTKSQRKWFPKGARIWGFTGGWKGCQVRDIKVESTFTENCRVVRKTLGVWGPGLFWEVKRLTDLHGHCTEWPDVLECRAAKVPGMPTPETPEWLSERSEHEAGLSDRGGAARSFEVSTVRLKNLETGEWHTHYIFRKKLAG